MRSRRFAPLLFVALLAAFACSKPADSSSVGAASPAVGEEIDPSQNLVFTFDEPGGARRPGRRALGHHPLRELRAGHAGQV